MFSAPCWCCGNDGVCLQRQIVDGLREGEAPKRFCRTSGVDRLPFACWSVVMGLLPLPRKIQVVGRFVDCLGYNCKCLADLWVRKVSAKSIQRASECLIHNIHLRYKGAESRVLLQADMTEQNVEK